MKYVDVNLCTSFDGQDCTTYSTFVITSSETDRHITSNFGVQVNTGNVKDIQSVVVTGDSGVMCSFTNNLISSAPSIMCGGWTKDINSNDPA